MLTGAGVSAESGVPTFREDANGYWSQFKPEEMASAVLSLASDDSSFMTASTFLVDGGLSAAYVTPL